MRRDRCRRRLNAPAPRSAERAGLQSSFTGRPGGPEGRRSAGISAEVVQLTDRRNPPETVQTGGQKKPAGKRSGRAQGAAVAVSLWAWKAGPDALDVSRAGCWLCRFPA
jgi:hypothetical protein